MKVTIKKQVGADVLTFTEDIKNSKELIDFSTNLVFLDRIPKSCTSCKGTSLFLQHRVTKGYDFLEVVCSSCGAKLKIHESKAGPLYIKYDEKFEKFVSKEKDADAPFNPEEDV